MDGKSVNLRDRLDKEFYANPHTVDPCTDPQNGESVVMRREGVFGTATKYLKSQA